MKKLFAALTSIAATALVAGPATTDATKSSQYEAGLYTGAQQEYTYRVGVVNRFTADRKLKNKTTKVHLDTASSTSSAVSLTFGMFNRFDLYATFGSGKAELSSKTTTVFTNITTKNGSNWSVGASGILYAIDNATLSLFGEYQKGKASLSSISRATSVTTSTGSAVVAALDETLSSDKARETEWAVGANGAYTIQVSPDMSVVPNFAISYGDAQQTYKDTAVATSNTVLKARNHFGLSIGCSLYAGKVFGLTVESKFLNESAVAVLAEIRL